MLSSSQGEATEHTDVVVRTSTPATRTENGLFPSSASKCSGEEQHHLHKQHSEDADSGKSFASSLSSSTSQQSSPIGSNSNKSVTTRTGAGKYDNLSASDVSELLAPYLHKPFYGKEWLLKKLAYYVVHKKLLTERFNGNPVELFSEPQAPSAADQTRLKSQSTCLLLLGDSGTGKTHLSCELKHPPPHNTATANPHVTVTGGELRSHFACVHFLSLFNKRQNSLKCFYLHLTRSLQELHARLVDNRQQKVLIARKKVIKLKRSDFLVSLSRGDRSGKEENNEDNDYDLIGRFSFRQKLFRQYFFGQI
jgi:hypothetical protein